MAQRTAPLAGSGGGYGVRGSTSAPIALQRVALLCGAAGKAVALLQMRLQLLQLHCSGSVAIPATALPLHFAMAWPQPRQQLQLDRVGAVNLEA